MALIHSLRRVANSIGINLGRHDKLEFKLSEFLCKIITDTARAYYPYMLEKPMHEEFTKIEHAKFYVIPPDRVTFHRLLCELYGWQFEQKSSLRAEFKFDTSTLGANSSIRKEMENIINIDPPYFKTFRFEINQQLHPDLLEFGTYSHSKTQNTLSITVGYLELAKTKEQYELRIDYLTKVIIHECNHIGNTYDSLPEYNKDWGGELLYLTSDSELRTHCAEMAKKYTEQYPTKIFNYRTFQDMMRKHAPDSRYRRIFFIWECLMNSQSSKQSLEYTPARDKFMELYNTILTNKGLLLQDGTYIDQKRARLITQKILNFMTYYVEVFNKRA